MSSCLRTVPRQDEIFRLIVSRVGRFRPSMGRFCFPTFVALVIDVFSRIGGWEADTTMHTSLVLDSPRWPRY
jgi:hypothetical protein